MKEPYLLWAPAIQIRMTEPGADRTPPFRFNPLITRGNPRCSRPHGRETSAVINTGTDVCAGATISNGIGLLLPGTGLRLHVF